MRERLRESAQAKSGPAWHYDPSLEYLKAAKKWGIDPDRWDEMTDEAKGEVVAEYRTAQTMKNWEALVFRPPRPGG